MRDMTQYNREYYHRTKARRRELADAWRKANPERKRENEKRWRENNPDKVVAAYKRLRDDPIRIEKVRQSSRKAYHKHAERKREENRQYQRARRKEQGDQIREQERQKRAANPEINRKHAYRGFIAKQMGVPYNAVPDELLEARYAVVRVKRAIRGIE